MCPVFTTQLPRRGSSAVTLTCLAILSVLLITAFEAPAHADCPLGLARVRSQQWLRVFDLGVVERNFELFGYVGPVNRRSHWRSISQSEDGRIQLVRELACHDGELLLVAQHDWRQGVQMIFDGGIPVLSDSRELGTFRIDGLARVTVAARDETISAFFRADVRYDPAGLVATPYGDLPATLTTIRLIVVGPSKVELLDTELSIWWISGAERFPARVRIVQSSPNPEASTFELVDSRIPRLTPSDLLHYIGLPVL